MKKHLTILFVVFLLSRSYSQTSPVYNQYMFNPVVVNPAYAGLHDMASVYGVYRSQWSSIEGVNPETFSVSGQTTLPKNNLAVGGGYVYDKYGYLETHDFNVLGAYKMELGNKSISFGLQGGIVGLQYDYSELNLKSGEEDDPEFSGIGSGYEMAPSLGFGFLYSGRTLFLGASMPRAIDIILEDGSASGTKIYKSYIVTSGYIFYLKNGVKLKPSFLARYIQGDELSYDLNMSLLLKDRFWVGASLRSLNTLTFMSQIKMSDYLTVGMAYELPIDNKKVSQLGNTFELMLNCNMALFDVQAVQTIFY